MGAGLLVLLGAVGCGSSVPEAVYRDDLFEQQRDYEERLERQRREQGRAVTELEQALEASEASVGRCLDRIQRLERQGSAASAAVAPAGAMRALDRSLRRAKVGRVAEEEDGRWTITFEIDALFPPGSTRLDPLATDGLRPLVEELVGHPGWQVEVRAAVRWAPGPGGDPAGRWRSAAGLAASFAEWLEERGIRGDRLRAVATPGLGEDARSLELSLRRGARPSKATRN